MLNSSSGHRCTLRSGFLLLRRWKLNFSLCEAGCPFVGGSTHGGHSRPGASRAHTCQGRPPPRGPEAGRPIRLSIPAFAWFCKLSFSKEICCFCRGDGSCLSGEIALSVRCHLLGSHVCSPAAGDPDLRVCGNRRALQTSPPTRGKSVPRTWTVLYFAMSEVPLLPKSEREK